MFSNFRFLYSENPEMFKKVFLFAMLHFISIGLVMPYTLLIQLKFTSLKNVMLLNGVGFLIGFSILYGFVSGKLPVIDVRKRLMFFKGMLMSARLSILLLLFYGDTVLKWPLLIWSVFGGTFSYPTINADYQYLVFKSYGLKHRVRLVSAINVMINVAYVSMNALTSLIYPRLYIVYALAVTIDIIAILSLLRIPGDYSYRVVGRIFSTFSITNLIVFFAMLLLQMTLVMVLFVQPVVFKSVGEWAVGYLFAVSSIVTAIVVNYLMPYISSSKPFTKAGIVSILTAILVFISVKSVYLSIIAVILAFSVSLTLILSLRHTVFKMNDKDLTWGVGAINEMLGSLAYIMFIPVSMMGNVSAVTIMIASAVILTIVSTILFYFVTKEHFKNPAST